MIQKRFCAICGSVFHARLKLFWPYIKEDEYKPMYSYWYMRIGCEWHSQADWWSFDDKPIAEMDGNDALLFWKKWKEPLRMMCEIHGDSK